MRESAFSILVLWRVYRGPGSTGLNLYPYIRLGPHWGGQDHFLTVYDDVPDAQLSGILAVGRPGEPRTSR
jgi:hypothetical protein